MTRRRLARRALALLASLLVTAGLVEAGFRVAGVRGDHDMQRRDVAFPREDGRAPAEGVVAYERIRTIYPTDPRGYFGPDRAVDHDFNALGFRDTERLMFKPKGTWRIVGLGDSYLYGQGVRAQDVCLARLERMLAADAPDGVRVEAVNMGRSGYNTVAERDVLKGVGLRHQPDLVLLHFVLNDVEPRILRAPDRPQMEFFREYISITTEPDALSRWSWAWGWARQRWLRTRAGAEHVRASIDDYLGDDARWPVCRDALEDIRRMCAVRDIPLVVVIFPFYYGLGSGYPFAPVHEQVAGWCRSAGVPVLDLRFAYAGYDGPELWVHPVDQHPNEVAHAIAAKAMHAFLMERREALRLFELDRAAPAGAPSPR